MPSVRDETGKTWWRKYHNIARVTGKRATPIMEITVTYTPSSGVNFPAYLIRLGRS